MHEIILTFRGKPYTFTLPARWDDLPSRSWPHVSKSWAHEGLYTRAMLSLLMRKLNGQKVSNQLLAQIPSEALGHLFECIAWMAQPRADPPVPYVKLSRWRSVRMHFPAPKMLNVTVAEFAFVDMAWELWRHYLRKGQHEQAQLWLARLCAYLLRPYDRRIKPSDARTYQGDRREVFNSAVCEARVAHWQKKMSIPIAKAVELYVSGCKHHIAKKYRVIWPSNDKQEIEEVIRRADKAKPEPKRWIDLARRMAGGRFGTFAQVMHTNIYTFLDEVADQTLAERERRRAEMVRRARRY